MSKVYQPIVIENCENIIGSLKEMNFFEDYEIHDLTYSRKRLCDILTEKYIDGLLNEDIIEIFTEEEFEKLLRDLAAGSVLYELKMKGFVDSYEDDDTEEMFFLTEKGKNYLDELRKEDNIQDDEMKKLIYMFFPDDNQSNSNV